MSPNATVFRTDLIVEPRETFDALRMGFFVTTDERIDIISSDVSRNSSQIVNCR